jgi:hypothetical protein
MTHFIRMMVIAAGIAGLSTVADAGIHFNALSGNGVKVNAIAPSGISTAADGKAVQGLFVIGFKLPIR